MAYIQEFERPSNRIDPTAHYIDNAADDRELRRDTDYLVVALGVITMSALGVIAMALFNNILKF